MSQTTILDPWPGQETVSVVDVARVAGLPRHDVRKVERAGLIEPVDRGRNGRYLLTHDDAVFLLAAGALASAAGIALVTVVRLLRQTGASIGATGFVIPVSASP